MSDPGAAFEINERFGKTMFSNGVTPDNIYRIVKALEKIAEALFDISHDGVKMR